MTPSKASLSLQIVSGAKEEVLTPQERRFAEEYFSGEHCGNAVRSYMSIYPDATYNTASAESSQLLKEPRVRDFLRDLQERVIDAAADRLQPWTELLGLAQSIIVSTAQGRLRNRLAYEAAVYLTNRCLGTPVATSETHVINHDKIAKAVVTFARRLADDQRKLPSDRVG